MNLTKKGLLCPNGHTTAQRSLLGAFVCDVCATNGAANESSCQCVQCDYDKCVGCLAVETGLKCPPKAGGCGFGAGSHSLVKFVTPVAGFHCDCCAISLPAYSATARCQSCDYDLCLSCVMAKAKGLPSAPMPFNFGPSNTATTTTAAPFVASRAVSDVNPAVLEATKRALDAVASKKGFSCKTVSWEDAQRGTVGGALSCFGANISDVRLWEKGGKLLYTLRTNNWNERLGYVAAKDVAVVVGNHSREPQPPTPITLRRYLKSFKEYAGYAGHTTESLFAEGVDDIFSIRFQAVFLPISDGTKATEFCTEVYNYNTHSDDDPRNVAMLCTAQGTSVQQDGRGAKKLFVHRIDGGGWVHRYWLEAEKSEHKVGGAQLETEEEAAAAAARGKATAIHIGTKAMGTRFNVQMLIQLPLKQKESNRIRPGIGFGGSNGMSFGGGGFSTGFRGGFGGGRGGGRGGGGSFGGAAPMACFSSSASAAPTGGGFGATNFVCAQNACPQPKMSSMATAGGFGCAASKPMQRFGLQHNPPAPPAIGTSNAARVSLGSEHDVWNGVSNKEPARDPSQHGTITVTLYYTVAGGVPSEADVESCIADLDALYKACPTDKKLVDCSEITAELTVKNMMDIHAKPNPVGFGTFGAAPPQTIPTVFSSSQPSASGFPMSGFPSAGTPGVFTAANMKAMSSQAQSKDEDDDFATL